MAQKQEKNLGGPVIQNKKAYFNFELVEKVEAGQRSKVCAINSANWTGLTPV